MKAWQCTVCKYIHRGETPPEKCPVCGSEVVREEQATALRCLNVACPAQVKERIRHFASKAAFDIDGMGYKLVDQLVDKGYLYIAQPPLFKIGKGRSESYLKDENEFNDYILKKICDKKQIKITKSGKILKDHHLFIFLCDLSEYSSAMAKLKNRGYDPSIVEMLIRADVQDKSFLQDQDKMVRLKQSVEAKGHITEALSWNEEDGIYELIVNSTDQNNFQQTIVIDRSLVYASDYQKCVMLNKKLEYQI